MQGLIDIEPKQYLDFAAEEGKLGQTTLTVFNLTSNQLSFKVSTLIYVQIKTANPMLFQVKPSIGIIAPNNQVSIVITTAQPLKENGNLNSKFQINACTLLQDEQGNTIFYKKDLTNFWKFVDAALIQQVQVRSRIKPVEVQQEILPQQIQQSVISENSDMMNLLYQSIVDPKSREQDEEIQRYQEQIDQMVCTLPISFQTKELSDYQLILRSVKQQQAAIKHLGNKFELNQMLIVGAISIVLGFIFGN